MVANELIEGHFTGSTSVRAFVRLSDECWCYAVEDIGHFFKGQFLINAHTNWCLRRYHGMRYVEQ